MNTLLTETKYLCHKYGLHPQRKSGQNFLINKEIFDRIIKEAEISPKDRVLEIGPGFGTLTQRLAEKAAKVWAVEIEKIFLPALKNMALMHPALKVIHGDILKTDINKLVKTGPYKLVANLPYNISSITLRIFLENAYKPEMIVLMLQKEVAERIMAKPGKLSMLAVSVQYYCQPKIIQIVNKDNFWPQPAVDSALMVFKNIRKENAPQDQNGQKLNDREFFRTIHAGFSAKRKQLANNLANSFHADKEKIIKFLNKLAIDPQIRPQSVSVEEWIKIVQELKINRIIKNT